MCLDEHDLWNITLKDSAMKREYWQSCDSKPFWITIYLEIRNKTWVNEDEAVGRKV